MRVRESACLSRFRKKAREKCFVLKRFDVRQKLRRRRQSERRVSAFSLFPFRRMWRKHRTDDVSELASNVDYRNLDRKDVRPID